ncbi:MAG: type I-MYXAN CRISPR-associated protein Cas6/Cmx6 [Pseudomonadota bacterium]|nr:type I-MYXAN CRISPR-associated protein Cas6/Cmx6 [Pseudomonadota bacterium]
MQENKPIFTSSMIDIAYTVDCKTLVYDHAFELSNQITNILPWLKDNKQNGIHMLHGPDAGNGWVRSTADTIFLSKRTRLIIRISKKNIELAKKLEGVKLKVFDDNIIVGKSYEKPLIAARDLFSKFVMIDNNITEEKFLELSNNELEKNGLSLNNAICGKTHTLEINKKTIYTRSIMLPSLSKQQSLIMQEMGLGDGRIFGCGLFVPHKSIDAVSNFKEED